MSKEKKQVESKYFAYKLTPLMLALCIGVIILCIVGIAVSLWRISVFGVKSLTDVIRYPFLICVCVFCIVFVIWMFFRSQYIVDDKNITTQFAFVKSKYPIEKITSMTLDRDTNKLTIQFGDEYIVLAVNPSWNEEFVRAILSVNDSIDYSFTLTENKP